MGLVDGPRILLTLPDTAWPLDGGKRLRSAGVLRGLASVAGRLDVAVLFSAVPPGRSPIPPDVTVHDWVRLSPAPRGRLTGAARSLSRGLPVHVGAQHWDVVRRRLAPWRERSYDLVWFGGLDHAQALRSTFTAPRRVVDCDDVETEKWRAFLASGDGGTVERVQRRVELPLWGRLQADVVRWADAVVVCSDLDARRLGSDRAVVVPNTYPEPPPLAAPRPATDGAADGAADAAAPGRDVRVLVVANWSTEQNVDAAGFAVREVLPEVRRLLPRARLRLVGRGSDAIADLADVEGVDVVGAVEDLGPELAAADVVLVPMRFGGGTRLKVLEALAHRVPVVSTTLGCEGTRARDDVHLLVRDSPAQIAAGVRDLVLDPARAARLVETGHELYRTSFTPQAAVDAVGRLVGRLLR